jgi:hypothetical protein
VPVGTLSLEAFPRTFTEPEPPLISDINWDNKIYLSGYDIFYPEQDSLAVTLYWGALDRMDISYSTFLHLIDPSSGEILSQADAIPRGWTYPTNWWEQSEWVEDTVVLSLADVPPGDYELLIGWYNSETGERLSANSATGEEFPDGAVLLTTTQH